MSNYTRKGMRIICKFDEVDWLSGLAYEVLDVIKNKIPKTDRKWRYKDRYFEVYAFPRNIELLEAVYAKERQTSLMLDKKGFDEFMAQFDEPEPVRVTDIAL